MLPYVGLYSQSVRGLKLGLYVVGQSRIYLTCVFVLPVSSGCWLLVGCSGYFFGNGRNNRIGLASVVWSGYRKRSRQFLLGRLVAWSVVWLVCGRLVALHQVCANLVLAHFGGWIGLRVVCCKNRVDEGGGCRPRTWSPRAGGGYPL